MRPSHVGRNNVEVTAATDVFSMSTYSLDPLIFHICLLLVNGQPNLRLVPDIGTSRANVLDFRVLGQYSIMAGYRYFKCALATRAYQLILLPKSFT